ncbi:hypothetical protein [Legionella clemsonensis]|uniref:Uncharacterized protein n=1 Tax=Legionella clemsonensis TaxID=1867846 RepID=A0A222P186_9GAMM|nr:hypothetical protein [Legionella clemsonensis]ASQ45596.1 hypothetical protein clem_05200 [Legionella clemsonensis]
MSNYGLAEINNLSDAKNAWESFFGRFFSPELSKGVNVEFDPDLREFIPRKNPDAKNKRADLTEERTLHSDDFDDFLNGDVVKIPDHFKLTQEGLEQVYQAIQRGNFEDAALTREDHTFYALWLFKQNRITRQQMATLLARDQIPREYPLVKTFKILDDNGEFTKEAVKLWLPVIKSDAFGGKFTDWHLERLRLLIQAAPKSEQIFYLSEPNPNIISSQKRELGNALQINHSWHRTLYQGKLYDLHMSFGVLEGIQIATSGISGAAASRAKLGKVGIDAVKEGVEFYYRPTAISMRNSGIEATTKGIHGYAESLMPAVSAHDVFHSRLHNTIKPEFHMMLNHMHQIIHQHTNQKWSKTMWELVDREFHAFQYQSINLDSPKEAARHFLRMLTGGNAIFLFHNNVDSALSDDGFAIVLNMVNESEIWKKLYKIDIEFLGDPYKAQIRKVKHFKEVIGNASLRPEILTLKYRFFSVLTVKEFNLVNRVIDSLGEQLVNSADQKLVFGKYAIDKIKNLTTLKFKTIDKDIVVNERSVRQLIPILANRQLASKLGVSDQQEVEKEVTVASKKFISTYQQGTLDNNALNESINRLPSIAAKLDFLEACYEKIIRSTGYSRRHAVADHLFAFFKNPLTTSQREHINLLKAKFNEVVSEYMRESNLSEEEKEELQWCLQNKGSNLARCKTDRFYLHFDSTVPSSSGGVKPL